MLNISPESREGGDVTFTVRGFWMVSAIWKVRVIGQMRVQAKPGVFLHFCVCTCLYQRRRKRQRRKSDEELE